MKQHTTHTHTHTFKRSQWPKKLRRYDNHTYIHTYIHTTHTHTNTHLPNTTKRGHNHNRNHKTQKQTQINTIIQKQTNTKNTHNDTNMHFLTYPTPQNASTITPPLRQRSAMCTAICSGVTLNQPTGGKKDKYIILRNEFFLIRASSVNF